MSGRSSYAKDFSRSKSGMAGLVMLIILIGLSVYVIVAYPPSTASLWNNPKQWADNPAKAPPSWIGVFTPNFPPTVSFPSLQWANVAPSGSPLYNYSNTYTFQWTSKQTPSDLVFVPQFTGTFAETQITWVKPDGDSVVMYISNPTDAYLYDVADPGISQWIQQYVETQTSTTVSGVTVPQEMAALFNKGGTDLMTNPVVQGEYKVRIDMVSQAPANVSSSTFLSLNGKSYGSMGTDLYGRPISLGILLGVPWALELGGVTSLVSVLFGVIFGGISGFIGGRRDGLMQWVTLVVLALPALPFLVVIGVTYAGKVDLITEGLIIAALSWPFYAIIARSVALSVKSQTFVEADKAMGVSALRTFFTHFMPRLTPVSIAYMALGVPGSIILAQTLAFLGIQPPNIVTWGGLLDEAFIQQAALFGWWWWVLFPGLMIVITAVPFVLVGFALDKIVAPKVNTK